jgi:hypothetical protein
MRTRSGGRLLTDWGLESIQKIRSEVAAKSEDYLLRVDEDTYTQYFIEHYELPHLVPDPDGEVHLEKVELPAALGGASRIVVDLHYPITATPRLDVVVEHLASTRSHSPYETPDLTGDCLVVRIDMRSEETQDQAREVEHARCHLEGLLERKNLDVDQVNRKLREQVPQIVNARISEVKRRRGSLNDLSAATGIPLRVKEDGLNRAVDLSVRQEIRPVLKPDAPPHERHYALEEDHLRAVLHFIRNTGYQYERTPRVFAALGEEDLRDIILGNLNAVFEGEAKGEAFSVLGKTDISLRIEEGQLLIVECKMWEGAQGYAQAINQLLGYLTHRDAHGIIVLFSRNKGFSHVLSEIRGAVEAHPTAVANSVADVDKGYLKSRNRSPNDDACVFHLHHLAFDLYALKTELDGGGDDTGNASDTQNDQDET